MTWQVNPLIKRGWERPLLWPMRRKGRRWCLHPLAVVTQAVLLPSTAWCIPHLGVSGADLNSSKIGAIARSINSGCSSHSRSNHNSSTVLVLYHHNRLQSGHHIRLPITIFYASTTESWDTLPMNGLRQSRTTHPRLRQLWSTGRRAHRGVLHHGLATPATPPGRRFP
jgi:hypothetical protein